MAKIKGIPSLQRKLQRLKTQTAPMMRPVMEQLAAGIVADMQKVVPVDDGDLRDSIGWTWGPPPKGSVSFTQRVSSNLAITIFAGNAKAFYARWVEFGTKGTTGSDKKRAHRATRAQPFFYPTFRANRKVFQRQVRKALHDAIKRAIQ